MSYLLSYLCNLVSSGDAFAIWYPELTNRLSGSEPGTQVCHILSAPGNNSHHGPTHDNWDDCQVEVDDRMFIDNAIIGVGYLVSNAFFYFLNSKVKILYIIAASMSACSACAFALPSLTNELAIVICFTIFIIGGGASINMANVLLVEIFPVFICGMALALAQLTGRLSTFIGANAIGLLLETDCELVIYATGGIIAVGVVSLMLLPKKIEK